MKMDERFDFSTFIVIDYSHHEWGYEMDVNQCSKNYSASTVCAPSQIGVSEVILQLLLEQFPSSVVAHLMPTGKL